MAPVLSAWDGGLAASGNTDIFNGTSGTLQPGDEIVITFTVEVDPDANGTAAALDNTAEATATDPTGAPVMDDSDSGSDPNSDNPNAPGDMGTPDDPTPLEIADVRTTKALSADPIDNGDGTWTLPFTLSLENTVTVDLTAPSITDDLQTELGAAVFQSVNTIALDTTGVVGGTAPAGTDAAWDGTDGSNILDGSGTLAPGDSLTVTFNVVVDGLSLIHI